MPGKRNPSWLGWSIVLALPVFLDACAGSMDLGERYQAAHPGAQPEGPHVGQPADESLALLYLDPAPGARVEVPFLELRRTDQAPWPVLSPEHAMTSPGRVAAVARRACRGSGVLAPRTERAAWYLFVEGRLQSWDLPRFGEGCRVEHDYRAARGSLADDERALRRWIAQRHAHALPSAGEQLEMGLSLVEAGRLEEAEASLQAADRALAELRRERRRAEEDGDDDALRALDEDERALRARRARLTRAIDARLDAQQQADRERWERGL